MIESTRARDGEHTPAAQAAVTRGSCGLHPQGYSRPCRYPGPRIGTGAGTGAGTGTGTGPGTGTGGAGTGPRTADNGDMLKIESPGTNKR